MARKPAQEEGAPLWVLTYGDMMSLLLCFFIMLVALSEIRQDEKYHKVVQSVREAFGFVGGMGAAPSDLPPDVSVTIRKMAQAAENFNLRKGDSADPGQQGRHATVQTVRDGLEFCLGGAAAFEEGKADLRPEVFDSLRKVASVIHGYNNKIEIRGHTSKAPLPADSPFKSHMELSLARALAVRNFLVEEGRIRPRRIRVTGVGDAEPLVERAYDFDERQANSRVEITVLESLLTDFEGDLAQTSDETP